MSGEKVSVQIERSAIQPQNNRNSITKINIPKDIARCLDRPTIKFDPSDWKLTATKKYPGLMPFLL